MKKLFLSICIIAFSLALCLFAPAFAEDIQLKRVLPDEDSYLNVNSPVFACATSDWFCVFEQNKLTVVTQTETKSVSLDAKVIDAYAYGTKIYAKFNANRKLQVFDVENLDAGATETAIDAQFISGEGGFLFVKNGYDVTKYSLPDLTLQNTYGSNIAETPTGIAVSNNVLYFIDSQDDYCVKSAELGSDDETTLFSEKYSQIAISQNVIVLVDMEGTLSARLTTGETVALPTSSYAEQKTGKVVSVCFSGGLLWVCDENTSGVNVFRFVNDDQGARFVYEKSYATYGESKERLHSPKSVCTIGNLTYVADSENDRVLVIGEQTNVIAPFNKPYLVQKIAEGIIVADLDGVWTYSYGPKVKIADELDVKAAAQSKNSVYIAVNEGGHGKIFAFAKDTSGASETGYIKSTFFEKDSELMSLCCSEQGSTVYAFFNDGICAIASSGEQLFAVSYQSAELYLEQGDVILSTAADRNGNVYALWTRGNVTTLTVLNRKLTSYSKQEQFAFDVEFSDFAIKSDGTLVLVACDLHSLYEAENFAVQTVTPTLTLPDDYVYYKSKTNVTEAPNVVRIKTNCFIYSNPYNYEDTERVPADEKLVCIYNGEITYNDTQYYYVLRNGTPGFIPVDSAEILDKGEPAPSRYDNVTKNHADVLYKFPIENDDYALLTTEDQTVIKLVSNVANFDGAQWYEILLDEKIYFIKRVYVDVQNPPAPQQYYYAKIKSDSFGKSVNVYALPDSSSALKGRLTDGSELKLFAPLNAGETYTYVLCGNVEGYVLTANVTTAGITSAQITGLVLIGVAATVSVCIFFLGKRLRKRNSEND